MLHFKRDVVGASRVEIHFSDNHKQFLESFIWRSYNTWLVEALRFTRGVRTTTSSCYFIAGCIMREVGVRWAVECRQRRGWRWKQCDVRRFERGAFRVSEKRSASKVYHNASTTHYRAFPKKNKGFSIYAYQVCLPTAMFIIARLATVWIVFVSILGREMFQNHIQHLQERCCATCSFKKVNVHLTPNHCIVGAGSMGK